MNKQNATNILLKSNSKNDLLKAIDYFENNNRLEFFKIIEGFDYFDSRREKITFLMDKETLRFSKLLTILDAWTASGMYYSEPHPEGNIQSFNRYIGTHKLVDIEIAKYYLSKRKNTLKFVNEQAYYEQDFLSLEALYVPQVLEKLSPISDKVDEIKIYGAMIYKIPMILIESYLNTSRIEFINCQKKQNFEEYHFSFTTQQDF